MHVCFCCLKDCLPLRVLSKIYIKISGIREVLQSVMKSFLLFSPANTASDKKLLIIVDTNILMNHLKFVRILKTIEIPGIYKTYLLTLIFLFELIFYVHRDMRFFPPTNTFPFGYVNKCIY